MHTHIKPMTNELEDRIRRNPSLNIDTFIIPSPYAADEHLEKNYDHCYVWEEEREILGFLECWTDPSRSRIHIYKQVTSPFGRSKGIGSAFLKKLALDAPEHSDIELYVWERQTEILSFYKRRGFEEKERLSWRALNFIRLSGKAALIREAIPKAGSEGGTADELGKIRHDAKKAIRLIADMAGALSAENCSRIIEDINRETTALVNTLNLFKDSVQRFRTVNLKDLVIDRIVPMIEHSPLSCELNLRFTSGVGEARAHYLEAGRAIVNLVSNALDAIRMAGRPGVLSIAIEESAGWIVLSVEDNGIGISSERLSPGSNGIPAFVGVTTKAEQGEGQGTRQIYTAFGADNISVRSEHNKGTRWTIRLPKAEYRDESYISTLGTRLAEFKALGITDTPEPDADKAEIAAFVWRCRKLEVLLWDLIIQFARKNNVRDLYRLFLSYRYGAVSATDFKTELAGFHTEIPELRSWLSDGIRLLKRGDTAMNIIAPEPAWTGIRFKSFGQASERTVIFTLDPASGHFGATDRKLAEHADFVPYLDGIREKLLRGEFFGDVQNPENPIQLGVWEIKSREDALKKAALIRSGARRLIDMSIPENKKLLFYETTWRRCNLDLDTGRPSTLKTIAELCDEGLEALIMETDDEFGEYICAD